jgi:hypothetical protein
MNGARTARTAGVTSLLSSYPGMMKEKDDDDDEKTDKTDNLYA